MALVANNPSYITKYMNTAALWRYLVLQYMTVWGFHIQELHHNEISCKQEAQIE